MASTLEWRNTAGRDGHAACLEKVFVHGLVRVEGPRARKMLDAGEPPALPLFAYLREVLAWAEELRKESSDFAKVRKEMERPEVRQALVDVQRWLDLGFRSAYDEVPLPRAVS